ncbi:MAG: hypothetical protein V1779_08875 [bacterium]
MKNKFINIICLCAILLSCSRSPEQYEKGIEEMEKKNYEAAIKSFLLVPSEEKEYKDSAAKQIVYCLDSLATNNHWEFANKQLKFIQLDSSALIASQIGIVKILDRIVKDGEWKTVLFALDTLDKEIIKPESVKKIRYAAEDSALKGIWSGIGEVKNKIKFVRKDSISNGICVKNYDGGWEENSIIYKNVRYEGNGIWDVYPKIFQQNIFGYSMGSYYSKKLGAIKFIGTDTIDINYERDLLSDDTQTWISKLIFIRDYEKIQKDNDEEFITDFDVFLGCWQGPYAKNKRTIEICFSSIVGSNVSGSDKLILPSGEIYKPTNFEGTINKSSDGTKIILKLFETGEGRIGSFEIIFDASNPVEGKGTWKSNDGKLVRDLTISKEEEDT